MIDCLSVCRPFSLVALDYAAVGISSGDERQDQDWSKHQSDSIAFLVVWQRRRDAHVIGARHESQRTHCMTDRSRQLQYPVSGEINRAAGAWCFVFQARRAYLCELLNDIYGVEAS